MREAGQAPDEVVRCLVLCCLRVGEAVLGWVESDGRLECCDVAHPLDEEGVAARGAAGVGAAPRAARHQAGVPFMTGTVISPLIAVTTSANAARRVSVGRSSL